MKLLFIQIKMISKILFGMKKFQNAKLSDSRWKNIFNFTININDD